MLLRVIKNDPLKHSQGKLNLQNLVPALLKRDIMLCKGNTGEFNHRGLGVATTVVVSTIVRLAFRGTRKQQRKGCKKTNLLHIIIFFSSFPLSDHKAHGPYI